MVMTRAAHQNISEMDRGVRDQILIGDAHSVNYFWKLRAPVYGISESWLNVSVEICLCGIYIWVQVSWKMKLCKDWWFKFKQITRVREASRLQYYKEVCYNQQFLIKQRRSEYDVIFHSGNLVLIHCRPCMHLLSIPVCNVKKLCSCNHERLFHSGLFRSLRTSFYSEGGIDKCPTLSDELEYKAIGS